MKLVLDTNVLVSGMIHAGGAPGRILDRVRSGDLVLVVDDRIMNEYTEVLRRPVFRKYFSLSQVRDIIAFLHMDAERVESKIALADFPDSSDIPFLEVALTAKVPLVTGNATHFPADRQEGAQVLSPADYVSQVLGESQRKREHP